MGWRTISLIILLTAAAFGSWLLSRSESGEAVNPVAAETEHRGYYLKQARILGTGPDGKLLYEIEARHAEQVEEKRIDFSDVRVRYSPTSEVPWELRADSATLQEDNPQIALRGHVIAFNRGESPDEETEIRTSYLSFDPERYVAETDDKVQVRFGARSLTATGMLASLNEQKIQLKSNVRGKIAP